MNDFILKHNVPILDTHVLKNKKGTVVRDIDDAMLQEICDNNNKRIAETGDMAPVVIGHTKDDAPETEQPKIVAYACNFKVAPLFKTGRKAIHCTFKFMKEHYDEAKKYPRRSVELWLDRMEIDPISLLGATSPERDLGLLKYNKAAQPVRYSRLSPSEETMPVDNQVQDKDTDLIQKVVAAVMETPLMKKLEALVNEAPADDGSQLEPADEGTVDNSGVVPDNDGSDANATPPQTGAVPPEGKKPVQYSAAAAPSGTNTFTPSDKDAVRMQREQDQVRFARIEQEHEKLRADNHNLKLKLARAEREKDLIQLESEGYQFDRTEELNDLQGLDDTTYKLRLERIKKRYARAPIGGGINSHDTRIPTGRRSKEDVDRIVTFASANGLTYEQALSKMAGEKVI